MASRQIILVSKFAEIWNSNFDMRVNELDAHIGQVDTKKKIDEVTEVYCADETKIVPLAKYKPPKVFLDAFSFYIVKN